VPLADCKIESMCAVAFSTAKLQEDFMMRAAFWRESTVSGKGEAQKSRSKLVFLSTMFFAVAPLVTQAAANVAEETLRIDGPLEGLKLALRHASAATPSTAISWSVVLILHGAGAPVVANPDFPQGGDSLMTALAEKGLDVWALDYYGFGSSDRYPEMSEPADAHTPLGRAEDCANQVDAAAEFLTRERHVDRIMLIGDSGGSLVAGVYATRQPNRVSRLILFGPETPYTDGPATNTVLPAYVYIAPADLWGQFAEWSQAAGKPDVLDASAYDQWAKAYLQSDPTSAGRTPPTVRIPNGRQADTADIERGRFTYDPGEIRAPTLIVMGEFDAIATLQGAQWLLKSLRQAPQRRLVVIGHASHTIQFEAERKQLYHVMADFLNEHE
jgi:pimeloyl-ACP methyl ester carboxylesterase